MQGKFKILFCLANLHRLHIDRIINKKKMFQFVENYLRIELYINVPSSYYGGSSAYRFFHF